jgi:adenylosuccinate synthase
MRHASRVNGITQLAITKLDVLDNLETIEICTSYESGGQVVKDFPTDIARLAKCRPIYEKMPGWREDTTKITNYADLPKNAKAYVEKLAELAEARIALISVGAERGQIITL